MEKNNKELSIGEIGVIDGVKVQCVKDNEKMCAKERCAYYTHSHNCGKCVSLTAECRSSYRSDHTDVYFKKIEE